MNLNEFLSLKTEQSDEEQSENSDVEQSEDEQTSAPVRSLRRSNRRNQSDDSDSAPLRQKRSRAKKRAEQDDDSYEELAVEVSTSTRRTATTIIQHVN